MFSPLRRLAGCCPTALQQLQHLQQFQPNRLVHLTAYQFKGHSKWQNIKATKGKNDMIKSKATNFLLRKVKGAVSRGGFDLKLNRELADLETEFRAQGLPLDTFKNFLQKMKVIFREKNKYWSASNNLLWCVQSCYNDKSAASKVDL